MPIKAVQQFFAWSYSRWSDYEKCPLSAKLKHLDKIQEPVNDAMLRGGEVDRKATDYVTGKLKKLPEELFRYEEEFKDLLKKKRILQPQQDLALTKLWTPTSWFGKDAWLRIKMDVFYDDLKTNVRKIIDYKTGKIRIEHENQLELYAVGGLAYAAKSIKTFETELWYLDQGHTTPKVFTRAEAESLKPKWEKRVKKMLSDTTFKPNPGSNCTWCYFGQSGKKKGGPGICRF
jgi:CRISPR/Cas system-associated exonuclease Cas4 (RecB family)